MEEKHYPFIDKETDIGGLEPFDILLVFGIPVTIGLLLFTVLPFGQILIAFGTLIAIAITFVWIRKKKQGKNPGYFYREIVYKKFRPYRKIY